MGPGPPLALAGDICCRAERPATTRWPTTTPIFLSTSWTSWTTWTTWKHRTNWLLVLLDHKELQEKWGILLVVVLMEINEFKRFKILLVVLLVVLSRKQIKKTKKK